MPDSEVGRAWSSKVQAAIDPFRHLYLLLVFSAGRTFVKVGVTKEENIKDRSWQLKDASGRMLQYVLVATFPYSVPHLSCSKKAHLYMQTALIEAVVKAILLGAGVRLTTCV